MTQHNVGALVVVKPGQDKSIAGIVTERGKFVCKLLCDKKRHNHETKECSAIVKEEEENTDVLGKEGLCKNL